MLHAASDCSNFMKKFTIEAFSRSIVYKYEKKNIYT